MLKKRLFDFYKINAFIVLGDISYMKLINYNKCKTKMISNNNKYISPFNLTNNKDLKIKFNLGLIFTSPYINHYFLLFAYKILFKFL